MDSNQRREILHQLAINISRRHLITPARLILGTIAPLGFLASQVALFVSPFMPPSRWRAYLAALEEAEGWNVLHDLLDSMEEAGENMLQ
jgi:hypothetical protein